MHSIVNAYSVFTKVTNFAQVRMMLQANASLQRKFLNAKVLKNLLFLNAKALLLAKLFK